jgi:hypothetical protein
MRWLLAPLLALSWFINIEVVAQNPEVAKQNLAPEIWFDPINKTDWLGLFQKSAPWPAGMNKVGVLVLEPGWVFSASDADLEMVINFVKQHHIKLDMDIQAVQKFQGAACGGGEGYSSLGDMANEAQILQRHGAKLDWIHIDEAVWFGHYSKPPSGCQLSIPDLITRTAVIVNSVLAVFPDVQVVEIEPIPAVTYNADWRETLTKFRLGLEQQIGKPIRDMQLDLNWVDPGWQNALTNMNAYLQERNIALGIFYNGSGYDVGDAGWISHAVRNFETVEGTMGIIPAQVIFATWNANPIYDLPETAPTAQTWLINRYTLPRTLIEAHFMGTGATGRLTTALGEPIPNATIQANVLGVSFAQPLPSAVMHGAVPANAVTALMGLRLNVGCACSGVSDVLVGTLQYQEAVGDVSKPPVPFMYPNATAVGGGGATIGGETVGGIRVTRLIVQPDQTFFANSPAFAVTANARYRFIVPAATVAGEGWYGSVVLIWLDVNVNIISIVSVMPDPGHVTISLATTAADGTFTIPKLPRVGAGTSPVTLHFDGAGVQRDATWTPLH